MYFAVIIDSTCVSFILAMKAEVRYTHTCSCLSLSQRLISLSTSLYHDNFMKSLDVFPTIIFCVRVYVWQSGGAMLLGKTSNALASY